MRKPARAVYVSLQRESSQAESGLYTVRVAFHFLADVGIIVVTSGQVPLYAERVLALC